MAFSSDVLRGHTETIILRILNESDNYGYEITKRIIDCGKGLIDVKDATIYTAFKRMEDDGYIETYWGDGANGARRKYYKITDGGKKAYKIKREEWIAAAEILGNLILGEEK